MKIKFLREQAGLSQDQLADRMDVSRQWISELERGIKTPTLTTCEKIAEALSLTPTEFFATLYKDANTML